MKKYRIIQLHESHRAEYIVANNTFLLRTESLGVVASNLGVLLYVLGNETPRPTSIRLSTIQETYVHRTLMQFDDIKVLKDEHPDLFI